jgi:hypothetical protein
MFRTTLGASDPAPESKSRIRASKIRVSGRRGVCRWASDAWHSPSRRGLKLRSCRRVRPGRRRRGRAPCTVRILLYVCHVGCQRRRRRRPPLSHCSLGLVSCPHIISALYLLASSPSCSRRPEESGSSQRLGCGPMIGGWAIPSLSYMLLLLHCSSCAWQLSGSSRRVQAAVCNILSAHAAI